jgi:heme oxygenase
MPSTTLLQNLRHATAALHDATERAVGIADPALDLDGYRQILLAFHGFYSQIEPAIPAYTDNTGAWIGGDRRKTGWLTRDLTALEIAADDTDAQPLLPESTAAAAQMGAMYVLEGATLGGQHVQRHVLPRLGIGPDNGGRFFSGYGERTGAVWRSFLAEMDVRVVTLADQDLAVLAACETFGSFLNWTSSCRSARRR